MRVIHAVLGPASPEANGMDAFSTDRADLTYSDQHPILVAGSSKAAIARGEKTAKACEIRIGGLLTMDEAVERLQIQQAKSTAVWVEVDQDRGRVMDELLSVIDRDVRDGRYAAVISTNVDALDVVAARIEASDVEIVVNGDDGERAAALALAIASQAISSTFSEAASDRSAERLRQLSDEVSRIAATLARLSAVPSAPRAPESLTPPDVPPLSADPIRNVIRARRLRARYFAEDLFADPAWDMLLDLLQAEIAQLRVPVSSLCIAAAVPATTALRWLKTMVAKGVFMRRADPHDGRRVFVELAPEASQALRRYFAEVGHVAVI
jgi:DNA-binding MarR family transcriptional regulator/uncharacterized membrane protein